MKDNGKGEAYRKSDNTLRIPQPSSPLLLTNRHPIQALNLNTLQWIIIRKSNHNLHHQFIHLVTGENLLRALRHLDNQLFLVFGWCFLIGSPLLDFVERVFDHEGREILSGPAVDGECGLSGVAAEPPGADEAGRVVQTEVVEVYEEPV